VRPYCPRRSWGVLLAPCADGRTRRKQGSQRTGTQAIKRGRLVLSFLPLHHCLVSLLHFHRYKPHNAEHRVTNKYSCRWPLKAILEWPISKTLSLRTFSSALADAWSAQISFPSGRVSVTQEKRNARFEQLLMLPLLGTFMRVALARSLPLYSAPCYSMLLCFAL
jgi:hypothetical protein